MAQDIEALAHRIGWLENNEKIYVAGNTYYDGNAFSVTAPGATLIRAIGKSFVSPEGINFCWIKGVMTSPGQTALSVTVSGITSKHLSNYYQNIQFMDVAAGSNVGRAGYIAENSGIITLVSPAIANTLWIFEATIELESKALWGYPI